MIDINQLIDATAVICTTDTTQVTMVRVTIFQLYCTKPTGQFVPLHTIIYTLYSVCWLLFYYNTLIFLGFFFILF